MQQVISFVLAAALLAAGLYLLYQELLVAPAVTVHMVLLGGLLSTGGAAWFWTEFRRS